MLSLEEHKRIVDLIIDPSTDFKQIVVDLATRFPFILLELVATEDNVLEFVVCKSLRESDGNRIIAIRDVRNYSRTLPVDHQNYDMGLRDSKEFVDATVIKFKINLK